MNYLTKIKRWIGVQQLRPKQEILDLLKKATQIETQEECNHSIMRKILKGTLWYQCSQCGMVMYIHGATGWHKSEIQKLIEALSKELKLEFKKEKKIERLKK